MIFLLCKQSITGICLYPATSEGVQATALVATIFVACALGIYFFYDDKEIATTIKQHTEKSAAEPAKE